MEDLAFIAAEVVEIVPEVQVDEELAMQEDKNADIDIQMEEEKLPTAVKVATTKLSLGDYLAKRKQLNALISSSESPVQKEGDVESTQVEMSGFVLPFKNSDMIMNCTSDEEEETSDSDSDEEIEEIIDEDDDGIAGELSSSAMPRTTNEMENLPPVGPPSVVRIPDQHPLIHIGTVSSIVNDMVLVESVPLFGENLALDIGSILAFEDRNVLGEVFETFGPVQQPFYIIRFNNASDIDSERTTVGAPIFQSPEFSKVIFTAILRAMKGSDASNLHDEEVPTEEQDFSDDEQEQQAKAAKKTRKRPHSSMNPPAATPISRPHPPRPTHPRQQQSSQPTQPQSYPQQQQQPVYQNMHPSMVPRGMPLYAYQPMAPMAPMAGQPPMMMPPMPFGVPITPFSQPYHPHGVVQHNHMFQPHHQPQQTILQQIQNLHNMLQQQQQQQQSYQQPPQ